MKIKQNKAIPLLSEKHKGKKDWFLKRLRDSRAVIVKIGNLNEKRLRNDLYTISMNYSSVNGLDWRVSIRKYKEGLMVCRVD